MGIRKVITSEHFRYEAPVTLIIATVLFLQGMSMGGVWGGAFLALPLVVPWVIMCVLRSNDDS
jgi:hypothetical protein